MDSARRSAHRGLIISAGLALMATTAFASTELGDPNAPNGTGMTAEAATSAGERLLSAQAAVDVPEYPPRVRLAGETTPSPSASAVPGEEETPAPETTSTGPTPDSEAVLKIAYRPGPSIHTEAVLALVVEHFPTDQVGNAMAVARCESGHSNAVGATNSNGTTDWGVFQLNDGGTLQGGLRRIGAAFTTTAEAQQLALDAETNVRAARTIYDNRGWAPWVCAYKTGIVAGLYSSTPGPMNGRYDERGLPGTVDLSRTQPSPGATIPTPKPPTPSPSAAATPRPTPATTPTASPSAPAASPTATPRPTRRPRRLPAPQHRRRPRRRRHRAQRPRRHPARPHHQRRRPVGRPNPPGPPPQRRRRAERLGQHRPTRHRRPRRRTQRPLRQPRPTPQPALRTSTSGAGGGPRPPGPGTVLRGRIELDCFGVLTRDARISTAGSSPPAERGRGRPGRGYRSR